MRDDVESGSRRTFIVLVSASAAAARALREALGRRGPLCVNVPDLRGARAVIAKVNPPVVVCDTEIDRPGSWRELTAESKLGLGFAVLVTHSTLDEALSVESRRERWPGHLDQAILESQMEWLLRVSNRGATANRPAVTEVITRQC